MVSVGLFGPVLLDLQSPNRIDDGADTAVVMLYMHGRFWWIAGICLAVAIVDSVRVSHRIAGPLVPMKRNLRALGDGKLPGPLRTRAHDYLKQEVEILNAASAGLARRIDALQQANAATVAELLRCSEALAGGSDGACAALTSAQQNAREVGQLLAGFERISGRDPSTAAREVAVAPCHC
jgi:methyl-accepting chemotaxis protein